MYGAEWWNCILLSKVLFGQWFDVVIHNINIDNKMFIVYSPQFEFRRAHLKCLRITIFVNRAECTQRLITRPTFMNQVSF